MCGRRHFVSYAAHGLAAAALRDVWPPPSFSATVQPVQVRVLLIPGMRAAEREQMRLLGVTMGAEEARYSAALFGGSVQLVVAERVRDGDLTATRQWLATTRPSVVLGGERADACRMLAGIAAQASVVYINVLCGADSLRGSDCHRHAFHVGPSDAMMRQALSQWSASKHVDSDAAEIVAWHSSLERFGADTLNQRFRRRFQSDMTGDAWAGWFAVKALCEAVQRSSSTDADTLIRHLESDTAQWDGHKGRPLSFRAWDHQLRQPLYALVRDDARGSRVDLELPSSQRSALTASSRDLLDELGPSSGRSSCRWNGEPS